MTDAADIVQIMPPVLSERKRPDTVYHYTSQYGLLGIAEKRKLWATNIRYLNDSQEFEGALSLATRYMEKECKNGDKERNGFAERVLAVLKTLPTEKFRVYVTSFSSQGDQLSQWRGYCPPGAGFSLGFNSDDLVILRRREFELVPCLYREDEQIRLISEMASIACENLAKDTPPEKVFALQMVKWGAAIKDRAFHEEEEWRLVSARFKPEPIFRAGKSFLVPYVEMDLTNRHTPRYKMDCISSVTVGPTPHPELSQRAVSDVFDRYEVNYGANRLSGVPFRSW